MWVTPEEIQQLAEFRGESIEEFSERFVRQVGDRYSLIEKPGGDCIFWDKQAGCTVYPAAADPVPNLAVLARERGNARGLGARPRGLPRLGARPPLLTSTRSDLPSR